MCVPSAESCVPRNRRHSPRQAAARRASPPREVQSRPGRRVTRSSWQVQREHEVRRPSSRRAALGSRSSPRPRRGLRPDPVRGERRAGRARMQRADFPCVYSSAHSSTESGRPPRASASSIESVNPQAISVQSVKTASVAVISKSRPVASIDPARSHCDHRRDPRDPGQHGSHDKSPARRRDATLVRATAGAARPARGNRPRAKGNRLGRNEINEHGPPAADWAS